MTDYTWDYRNRLTEVTFKTSAGQVTEQVEYAYDYQNRLVREVINPGTTNQQKMVYVYDGNQIVLGFNGTANATSGDPPLAAANLSDRYLWTQAADQLLADEQLLPASGGNGNNLTQPGNVLWALTDNLGTVRDLAEYNPATQTTSIVNHQVFSAFGQLESQTNLSNPQAAAVDCLFGFTGQLFDTATGLQNNGNRWYDPATGTWLSQDPIGFAGGDANLQRYVGNIPTNRKDPTGLFPNEWPIPYTPTPAQGVHPIPPPIPPNPGIAPGPGWTWDPHGTPAGSPPGTPGGSWVGPDGDTLHPDLHHGPGKLPHWDWKDKWGNKWEYYPNNGKWIPKPGFKNNPNKPQPLFPPGTFEKMAEVAGWGAVIGTAAWFLWEVVASLSATKCASVTTRDVLTAEICLKRIN